MQNLIPLKTGSGEFNSIYFFLICNLSRVAMVLIQTLMLQEHALRWQWGMWLSFSSFSLPLLAKSALV